MHLGNNFRHLLIPPSNLLQPKQGHILLTLCKRGIKKVQTVINYKIQLHRFPDTLLIPAAQVPAAELKAP